MNMNTCIISFVKEYKTNIISVINYLDNCTDVTENKIRIPVINMCSPPES